jgi:hypothetical protein
MVQGGEERRDACLCIPPPHSAKFFVFLFTPLVGGALGFIIHEKSWLASCRCHDALAGDLRAHELEMLIT